LVGHSFLELLDFFGVAEEIVFHEVEIIVKLEHVGKCRGEVEADDVFVADALEVLDELPDADIILVPIGGGGLISGIASAAKLKNPLIKIIGVEPEGAASALEARKSHHVVELDEANTIADGTAVKKIGDITFDYIEKYVDDIVTVSDYELMAAFLVLVEKHKIVAENAGVLSVAALRKINENSAISASSRYLEFFLSRM